MQEKGNSGILQVEQCPVSKMTDPLQLLSANAQRIASLSREIPPRAGGQLGEEVQPEVWANIWKVTLSLVKL